MSPVQFLRKSPANGKNLLYAWFEAMHTRVDMLLSADLPHAQLEGAASTMQAKIDAIEAIANRFKPGSELDYINRNAFTQSCTVSGELAEMIRECLSFHPKTFGCFDITVNSLNHFRSGTGFIQLDVENKTIRFQHPDLQIDLNGYVKGYALRVLSRMLSDNAIRDALISMGNSSILAIGNHPYGKGWSVGLDPVFKNREKAVTLFNECLTTSGNGLKKRRHIIDPETGEWIDKTAPVSVITSDPAWGEILSTAFFVADAVSRERMLEELPVRLAQLYAQSCSEDLSLQIYSLLTFFKY
jgi:thiamine biosynthesis lipoprotein